MSRFSKSSSKAKGVQVSGGLTYWAPGEKHIYLKRGVEDRQYDFS